MTTINTCILYLTAAFVRREPCSAALCLSVADSDSLRDVLIKHFRLQVDLHVWTTRLQTRYHTEQLQIHTADRNELIDTRRCSQIRGRRQICGFKVVYKSRCLLKIAYCKFGYGSVSYSYKITFFFVHKKYCNGKNYTRIKKNAFLNSENDPNLTKCDDHFSPSLMIFTD